MPEPTATTSGPTSLRSILMPRPGWTRFRDAAASLAELPLRGRAASVPGARELLPHPSYRLIYEVMGDTVWVLALVHTARQWPPVP